MFANLHKKAHTRNVAKEKIEKSLEALGVDVKKAKD